MKIIPTPKKCETFDGIFHLEDLKAVKLPILDRRVTKIAVTLKGEIEELAGNTLKLRTVGECCKCKCPAVEITFENEKEKPEGYTLEISDCGVKICGKGPAGAYYGVQTLRQIIHENGTDLPFCRIEDAPDFTERGFYHDVTRGKVPTLDQLLKITDMLAYYKINSLQLYVEDAYEFAEYDGIMKAEEMLTAEEIMALDDYCYDNFIELVPSIATFGHLYNLLQSEKYSHLCELENYKPGAVYWIEKMAHHTIDVSNPDSIKLIKSLIDQYIPLFRSDKFNICCDETFDLCRGRNTGKDAGEEYFKFLMQIIEHVKSRGKTVMMWGDIALAQPDKLHYIPKDTIMLNWTYLKDPDENKIATMAKAGLSQIVCPGTSSWNRFVEEIDRSEGNITKLTEYGKKYGALGVLNTNWGDFGNICAFNCSLYGMVMGAEKGWSTDSVLTEEFERTASSLLYDCDDVNMIAVIREMGRCERTCDWMDFMYWFSANTVEGRVTELKCDTDLAIANIKRLDELMEIINSVDTEDERYADLIDACRAIKIMNRVCLGIKGVEGYTDAKTLSDEIEAWLPHYIEAWRRENKESQLSYVVDFMRALPTQKYNTDAPVEAAVTADRDV